MRDREDGERLRAGRGQGQPAARSLVERGALAGGVSPAVLHAGDHAQPARVEGGDLAGGDAGERGELLGDEARYASGVAEQEPDEVEARGQRRVEYRHAALQRGDQVGVGGGGALLLERPAAAGAPCRDRRHDLVAQVATMAARAAIRGEKAVVGPAAHRVAAHAEQSGHLADTQPGGVGGRCDLAGGLLLHGPSSIGLRAREVNQSSQRR